MNPKIHIIGAGMAGSEAAGGMITDWDGQTLRLRDGTYDVIAAGDARVHAEALKALR